MFEENLKLIHLLTAIIVVIVVGREQICVHANKVLNVDLSNQVWTLRNENGSIEVTVPKIPSGVYTAVKDLYGDILQATNDIDLQWIAYENWTYIQKFERYSDEARAINLTLFGVDTISTIRLNDVVIGKTDNMFVQYSFNVLPYLQDYNVLEIEIMSPIKAAEMYADNLLAKNITAPPSCEDLDEWSVCHRNMLRKMQSSFGTAETLAAPSMGIWQLVMLEYYEVAILRNIDIAVNKNATHWIMDIHVFLETDLQEDFYVNLTFYAADLLSTPMNINQRLSFVSPVLQFEVPIAMGIPELWWPNGYGAQKLYPLYFTANCWLEAQGSHIHLRSISEKFIKLGFRTIELIEDEDTYGRSFYFKVNDKPIFVKGANYLPSHMLPELSNDPDRIDQILQSAKNIHMNMIRVWGGGVYESDYFYTMADSLGLLIWQDMAFTKATYPVTDDLVASICLETSQNAKRLAYHPSLALMVTNDEIELYLTKNTAQFGYDSLRLEEEYKQLFRGTIKYELKVISRNAFSPRPGPMLSTPSRGIEESKNNIDLRTQDPGYGDIHFEDEENDAWDPDIYPRARFVSAYGFQSLPLLASWNMTLNAEHKLATNETISDLMKHRQHNPKQFQPILQLIERHLPMPWTNWEENVDAFIYLSQVAQAMAAKTATELFRSQRADHRTMGVLYWHLNDVWVAPTTSIMDFYGNYKLLYYWSKDFLAPTAISALYDVNNDVINVTLVRDDDLTDFDDSQVYDVTINTYTWSELYAKKVRTRRTSMNSNAVQQIYVSLESILVDNYNKSNCFLEFVLSETDDDTNENTILSNTFFFFPGSIPTAVGIRDPQLTIEISWRYCTDDLVSDGSYHTISYSLTVRVVYPALFVYIEIYHPDIGNYTLSENGFVQVAPIKMIHLDIKNKSGCVTITEENIKVLTVNQYLLATPGGSSGSATTDAPADAPTDATTDATTEAPATASTLCCSTLS